MANNLPYDSYGSSGPSSYQSDTFQPITQLGQSQPATTTSSAPGIMPSNPNQEIPSNQSAQLSPNATPVSMLSALRPTPPAGNLAKEQLESRPITSTEMVPIVEVGTAEHDAIPEAVEGWLEKLERREADLPPDQVITDNQNQPVLQSVNPQISEDQIILPLEEADLSAGVKQKPTTSLRWLAEWCLRIIKKFPGKVFYAS